PAGNNGAGLWGTGFPLVGDFDGDGRQDVYQYESTWASIPVCLARGQDGAWAWSCYNLRADGIYGGGTPLIGDFDGDGRQDLYQYRSEWQTIPVCLARGSAGAWSWSCTNHQASYVGGDYPAGNNGSGIYGGGLPLVGDFNGDGKQDLFQYNAGWKSIPVCLSSGDPATVAWSCSNLQARFDGGDSPAGNDGSGIFAGGFAFAADVDGDGKTD